MKKMQVLLFFTILFNLWNCSDSENDASTDDDTPILNSDVEFWLTKADESVLLAKQNETIGFVNTQNSNTVIEVNENQIFQTVDGFGFTLTGGSAAVISNLDAGTRNNLLQELFGNGENSIKMQVLRLSIGASDLNETAFTYNDLPNGETDVNLEQFSIANDMQVVNLVKEILTINPNLKIIATPWSAPAWMKTNGNLIGGNLKTEYYGVYANYFVKYLQAMQAEGVSIFAITPQNEPEHPGNEPSMLMTAAEQTEFIKNHLGPAFQTNSIATKIIIYDHNCDHPDYPISVLSDPEANAYIDGSAFHLYLGDISAMGQVHDAFPDKNVYFTEQYTPSDGEFGGDLKWHIKNVMIGSMRNWSKMAFEWNLANDQNFNPHTPGGCTTCKGGLTINGQNVERNVGYYIVAQLSKFVPAGAKRIGSSQSGNLATVAFLLPDNKKVLVVLNEGSTVANFDLKFQGKFASINLDGNSVGTFLWD